MVNEITTEIRQSLAENLNQNSFVRLAADVLFTRGHTQIRPTDGPGDGGRDIHSLDSNGQPHLTQCKYHRDSSQTCSSTELSELPMAMTKLGYAHGLFITTARISPQGKREFLNDFPDLELDFLDGEELAREVLSNGLLAALWWEGKHFSRVNISTIFPVIIRTHDDDLPFSPFLTLTEEEAAPFFECLSKSHPQTVFSLQSGTSSTEPFEPYRYPEPFTMEEGALPFITVLEVAVTGQVSLDEINKISGRIPKAICSWLFPTLGGLSIRVGRPQIVPLQGPNSGTRIISNVSATSFTATSCFCAEESEWFSVGTTNGWSAASDARVSEATWIRLYADELDCCLAYEVKTRISSARKKYEEALREIQLKGWELSVFGLVPEWNDWPYSEIPEPDETVRWSWDGRILCGWFHWTILGAPVPIRSSRNSSFPTPNEEIVRERLESIAEFLSSQREITVLDQNSARHMVAIVGDNPFPDLGFTKIDTADVVYYPETIPSPISPQARRFRVSMAWRSDIDVERLAVATVDACSGSIAQFQTTVHCERWEDYVCCNIDTIPLNLNVAPTERLLNEIRDWLTSLLPEIKSRFQQYGDFETATKEYWSLRYDVNFGMTFEQSDKCYVGTFNADGSVEKLDPKIFLERGFKAAIEEREKTRETSE